VTEDDQDARPFSNKEVRKVNDDLWTVGSNLEPSAFGVDGPQFSQDEPALPKKAVHFDNESHRQINIELPETTSKRKMKNSRENMILRNIGGGTGSNIEVRESKVTKSVESLPPV
jgi:hypothetical protein